MVVFTSILPEKPVLILFWRNYRKLYKEKLEFRSVLVLCFTEARETYHHWKIFSGGTCGVCIVFNKENLIDNIKNIDGFRMGYVTYRYVDDLNKDNPPISQLPFLKRKAFKDEKEFRIIYESCSEEITSKDIPVNINCISRIIFNPWIPISVYNSVKAVIRKIDDCTEIQIGRTDLINNERWKRIGNELLKSHTATSNQN